MGRFLAALLVVLFALLAAVLVCSCSDSKTSTVPVYSYKGVNIYPHDRNAFTQGLVFEKGVLYEGTGHFGKSTLRKVDLETGSVLKLHKLQARFFGEGLTVYGDKIIQLTWRSNIGFVYDKNSFELLQQFDYPAEGWGITHDGKRLITSNGTSTLRFLHPQTFEQIGLLEVHDDTSPVTGINELEYVQGQVYANIWRKNRIAVISVQTGRVTAWIKLAGLLPLRDRLRRVNVLNGIAYDADSDRLFVTGKLWPKLFEIKIIPPG
jgi:glutamine cyclotransferase